MKEFYVDLYNAMRTTMNPLSLGLEGAIEALLKVSSVFPELKQEGINFHASMKGFVESLIDLSNKIASGLIASDLRGDQDFDQLSTVYNIIRSKKEFFDRTCVIDSVETMTDEQLVKEIKTIIMLYDECYQNANGLNDNAGDNEDVAEMIQKLSGYYNILGYELSDQQSAALRDILMSVANLQQRRIAFSESALSWFEILTTLPQVTFGYIAEDILDVQQAIREDLEKDNLLLEQLKSSPFMQQTAGGPIRTEDKHTDHRARPY